ncbi:hypothetical protein [Desulfofustis limnaeus]|uniref:Uncharacterized protein n=1 Tax=Desulfofustis limnaeus TaxID=2740163 RepID=A0ABM7W4V8_9BACT|nr:hypothetical protein [Desulfofustis limnaeus]BDD85965.1 hypothetical protein DPPLL_03300 [Desulfofustis limnaeus]
MSVLDPLIGWLLAKNIKRFSLERAVAGTKLPRKPVLRALDLLTREGYLEQIDERWERVDLRVGGKPRRQPRWKVVKSPGERKKTRALKTTKRAKIWKIIRAKRYFTKADLVITSGATEDNVDEYVRLLKNAGYVRKTGKDGRRDVFMLVRDQLEHPPLQREVGHV